MSGEPIPVDDLLDMQEQSGQLLATVQRVPDDDTRVKVTPYVPGAGCLCPFALTVTKEAFESVTPTDDVHACCGKTLKVVAVKFRDVNLADVFQQLTANVKAREDSERAHHGHVDMRPGRAGSPSPPSGSAPPWFRPRYGPASPPGYLRQFGYPSGPGAGHFSGSTRYEGMYDCLLGCEDNYNLCVFQCIPDQTFEYCDCECKNSKSMCYMSCGAWGPPLRNCLWNF